MLIEYKSQMVEIHQAAWVIPRVRSENRTKTSTDRTAKGTDLHYIIKQNQNKKDQTQESEPQKPEIKR